MTPVNNNNLSMKILVVTSKPDRPEHHLLCGIASKGHTILICAEFPKTLLGIPAQATYHLPVKSRIDPAAILRLRGIITKEKPDVIHSFSARSLTTALLASAGLKTAHVAYRGTTGHLSKFSPLSWLSFLHTRVHGISCVSNAVERYLEGLGIPKERLKTIYKGHNTSWYTQATPQTRKSLGIPDEAFVVGFVGNMRPVKGADLLLKSAFKLPTDGSIHLLLVGDLRDKSIKKMYDKHPLKKFIHLTGFHPSPSELLPIMDVFCMPSREREGLPKAVIEAMSIGIPPIVTNVGGMPELVINNECGIVIPPNNPEALLSAIIELKQSKDLCKKLGLAATRRIQDNFKIEDTIEETIALYLNAIALSEVSTR